MITVMVEEVEVEVEVEVVEAEEVTKDEQWTIILVAIRSTHCVRLVIKQVSCTRRL